MEQGSRKPAGTMAHADGMPPKAGIHAGRQICTEGQPLPRVPTEIETECTQGGTQPLTRGQP